MFINVCGSPKLPLPGGWRPGEVPAEVRASCHGVAWRRARVLPCSLQPAASHSRPPTLSCNPIHLITAAAVPGGGAGRRGATSRHALPAQHGAAPPGHRPPWRALPGCALRSPAGWLAGRLSRACCSCTARRVSGCASSNALHKPRRATPTPAVDLPSSLPRPSSAGLHCQLRRACAVRAVPPSQGLPHPAGTGRRTAEGGRRWVGLAGAGCAAGAGSRRAAFWACQPPGLAGCSTRHPRPRHQLLCRWAAHWTRSTAFPRCGTRAVRLLRSSFELRAVA